MTHIDISNISKSFGKNEALKKVSITSSKAEMIVVLGASGSGKTTFLRILSGLEKPTSGHLYLNGDDISGTSASDRGFAMMFQNYALYPHFTVYANMEFCLKNLGINKVEREERIKKVATSLGIDRFLDRYPNQLSGGQRQRVAMGRAVVRKPNLFLFDEPLSNLDIHLRERIRHEILDLQKRQNITAFYVTHDQKDAMVMADKVLVLRHGELLQFDSPLRIYKYPSCLYVASFIGSPSINIYSASYDKNTRSIHNKVFSFVWRKDRIIDLPRNVTLGIRPEHIRVQKPKSAHVIELKSSVTRIEWLGADTILYAKMKKNDTITVNLRGMVNNFTVNALVTFYIDIEDILLFDAHTGKRILTNSKKME